MTIYLTNRGLEIEKADDEDIRKFRMQYVDTICAEYEAPPALNPTTLHTEVATTTTNEFVCEDQI